MDKVSVIIPTFKGSNNLGRAIRSVQAQTYRNVEIIVVDDNAPHSPQRKATQAVMDQYKDVRYLKQPDNLNGAVARNTGIAAASGRWVCFLDDDDYYFPSRIEDCVNFVHANPSYIGVYARVAVLKQHRLAWVSSVKDRLNDIDLLEDNGAIGSGSNIFLLRESIIGVGGFDETFLRHQDLEFMIRISQNGIVAGLDQVLIVKSENGNSNVPEFYKFRAQKQKFYTKFKSLLNDTPGLHDHFFSYQYAELFQVALKSDILALQQARGLLESIRPLTATESIEYWLRMFRLYSLFRKIAKYFERKVGHATSNESFGLTIDEEKFIQSVELH